MIRINQSSAQIGLKISKPGMRMQTRDPLLKLKQTLPRAELKLEGARVDLDSTRCWAEIGIKRPLAFTRDNAQKGYQACFSYTGQVASEGDMMAHPEKYNIENIMAYFGSKAFEKFDFNVTQIPRSPVDVEIIPARTEINWQMGRVKGDFQPGDMTVKGIWGRVDVYLRQKAGIKTEYVPEVDVYR